MLRCSKKQTAYPLTATQAPIPHLYTSVCRPIGSRLVKIFSEFISSIIYRKFMHVMRLQESFQVKKVCITKSVIFGILQKCPEIAEPIPKERQIYEDGTIFQVKNFRALCAAIMNAYMELSSEPGALLESLQDIMHFLDRNIPYYESGGSCRRGGLSSSSCQPWLSLKNSLKEANIQPLALVLRNAQLVAEQ